MSTGPFGSEASSLANLAAVVAVDIVAVEDVAKAGA